MELLSPRTALVDESYRRAPDGRGYYLMAAVVVPDVHQAAIVSELRAMLPKGQRRWHFTAENDASRAKFVSRVAELQSLEVVAVAVAQETPDERKSEQARTRCLWGLLAALDERGVQSLVLEHRQEHLDRRDRREIENVKRAGFIVGTAYRHDRPMEEPLLWLPDALAGAVGLHLVGRGELLDLVPDGMCEVRWV